MDQYVGMEMEGQIVLDDENLLGRGIDLGEGAIKGDELIDADAAVLGIEEAASSSAGTTCRSR